MNFSEYYNNIELVTKKGMYKGISKKEYAKWIGWNVIKKDENSKIIPVLVHNFYYIQYIKSII